MSPGNRSPSCRWLAARPKRTPPRLHRRRIAQVHQHEPPHQDVEGRRQAARALGGPGALDVAAIRPMVRTFLRLSWREGHPLPLARGGGQIDCVPGGRVGAIGRRECRRRESIPRRVSALGDRGRLARRSPLVPPRRSGFLSMTLFASMFIDCENRPDRPPMARAARRAPRRPSDRPMKSNRGGKR